MKNFEFECDQITELDSKELSSYNGGCFLLSTWAEILSNGIS